MTRACYLVLAGLAPLILTACERSADGTLSGDVPSLAAGVDEPAGMVAATASDSLFAVAMDQYGAWEMDSARINFSSASEHARLASDPAAEARALTRLGLVAWRLGEYPEARRQGQAALDLKLRHGLDDQLFDSYNALGLLAWTSESRYADALELYGRAEEFAEAAADTANLAKVWSNLGNIHTDLGEFGEARRLFPRALEAARIAENPMIEGRVLTNLGMLAVRTGDPAAAVGYLQDAVRRSSEADDPLGHQAAVAHLGTAYAALGEPGRAIAYLDSALVEARAAGHRQEEASNLSQLAELHRQAGDHPGALRLLADATVINAELELFDEMAADLRMEAQIHAALGNLEPSRRSAAEALEIHREVGAQFEVLGDLLLLAELSHAAGDPNESTMHLRAAEEVARTLDAPTARAAVVLAGARIADRDGDSPGVLRSLQAAEQDLLSVGAEARWEGHALAARAYLRGGELDSAAIYGRRAVEVIERTRGHLGSGLLRTSYLAERSEVYRVLVDALLRQGRLEEAFEVADGLRGRALLEQAATRVSGTSPGSAPLRQLAEEERQILRSIDTLVVRIAEARAAVDDEGASARRAERDRLYDELEEKRTEYSTALVRSEERRSTDVALLGGRRPTGSEVREALRPGEVLLHYTVMPDRVLLFVLRPNSVRMTSAVIPQERLAARVRVARELLGGPAAGKGRGASEALYDLLVQPAVEIGAIEQGETLLIVADAELTYLPFAALRSPSSGRYLAKEHPLLHLPSAGALPALRSRDRSGGTSAPAALFAPSPEELPATSGEVDALRDVLPRSEDYRAGEASERRFREALTHAPIVHAATHGIMNARSPLFSRLELARGRSSEPENDGRLEVHELLELPIGASLVFLSGCETGVGPAWATGFSRGEDYATLARAFLYAGAENVVATLWRVEDEGAAVFAAAFYRELAVETDGTVPALDVAAALARAQRTTMADPRFAEPYYWAGYRVSGSGRVGHEFP